MDRLCSRCLAYLALRQDEATLTILEPDDTPSSFAAAHYDLAELAEAIRKAFGCGWTVKINTVRIDPAVTTWQGDPICELHLFEQAVEEEQRQNERTPAVAFVPHLNYRVL